MPIPKGVLTLVSDADYNACTGEWNVQGRAGTLQRGESNEKEAL